jgi:hypothetical protein
MTYWLGIDTPEVWEKAEQKYNRNGPHLFGFPEGRRKYVQQMQIGDRIVNYITKRQRFFAVWEITKGYTYNPTHTFANRVFPECVEVRPVVRLAPEEGVENPGVGVRQSAVRLRDEVGERILSALKDRVSASELEVDLQAINQQKTATERKQYIDARLGQGQFRTMLLERWGNRCAVTGNAVRDAIRASHAKPWKISSDRERLDPENGLPLLATLDALLDAGLITFDETDRMTLSQKLTVREQAELDQLGVGNSLRLRREPTEKERSFLAYHRDNVFEKWRR